MEKQPELNNDGLLLVQVTITDGKREIYIPGQEWDEDEQQWISVDDPNIGTTQFDIIEEISLEQIEEDAT